jgi:hypothetical protein
VANTAGPTRFADKLSSKSKEERASSKREAPALLCDVCACVVGDTGDRSWPASQVWAPTARREGLEATLWRRSKKALCADSSGGFQAECLSSEAKANRLIPGDIKVTICICGSYR